SVFTFVLFSYYSGRFINYPLKEQTKDILPILLLSMGIGTAIYLLDNWVSGMSNFSRLLIGFGVGAGLYWLVVHLLQLDPYREFKQLVQEKVLSKLNKRS